MTGTTRDGFLGGRLQIAQPERGYRAGMDPVLLAAAVDAAPGDRVLDLGCGVGVALFCLMARVQGLAATGVEVQPDLADLARANAAQNGFDARIVAADIAALPDDLRAQSFDHVLTNPPFFDRDAGTRAAVPGREAGRGEDLPLPNWIDIATRRLAPRGRLWIIQRTSRLPDVLAALDDRLGDITVLPLAARAHRPAETVIVAARKSGRGAFRLLAPVVLHAGATHVDGDGHSDLARAVLRDGAALPMT